MTLRRWYGLAAGVGWSAAIGRVAVRLLILMAVTLPWLARGSVDAKLAVGDYEIIGEVLHATDMEEWPRAFRLMDGLDDPLASKLFHWITLIEDRAGAGFDELARFIIENPTWPRIEDLQKKAEGRLTDSADQKLTLQLFEDREPLTTRGRIRLAEALFATDREGEGAALIKQAWVAGEFTAKEEESFLRRHKSHLGRDDHEARLENMLWDRSWRAAGRMLSKVSKDQKRLAEARLALQQRSRGVDRAIAAVPARLEKDPGLVLDRIRWRRQKKKHDGAVALLLDPPEELGRADHWWYERSYQVRRAIDRRDFDAAYQLASRHGQLNGGAYAEAEWLSGWLALRFSNQPKAAFRHFVRLYDRVMPPVRQARAAYWAGRAAAAQGDDAGATAWYRRAASHHVAYYGQLAARELGGTMLIRKPAGPTEVERAAFDAQDTAQAARMLIAARAFTHLDPFLLALSDQAETATGIAMITELAVAAGRPSLLARIGRRAAFEGKVYDPAAFPVPRIDGLLDPDAEAVEPPLLLGMARQESMFRSGAASNAGARGLLQLLPSTARIVAGRVGADYDVDRLIADPNYNAMLGGHYLKFMLERFDGEPVLALAAYNAGPLRVKQWIDKHGDPRTGNAHDLVDWVELIPFVETRTYVQRVLEGYQVYKQRLADSNVALLDYPDSTSLSPLPLPAPKPREEAAASARPANSKVAATTSFRPVFKPLDALPGPSSPASTSIAKTFDDRERQRVAADGGEARTIIDRPLELAPKL